METQIVRIYVTQPDAPRAIAAADVVAECLGGGYIVTATDGRGGNCTVDPVAVGGHKLESRWGGDARVLPGIHIGPDHPLAEAVKTLAQYQGCRDDVAEWSRRTDPPIGWDKREWAQTIGRAATDRDAARRIIDADPALLAMLPAE